MNLLLSQKLAEGNDEYHGKVVSKNNLFSLFFSNSLLLVITAIKRKTSLPDNF